MRVGSAVRQSGFTLVAVLAAMFIVAIGTQKVMTYVSHQAQREREAELLRIGQAYVQAIGAYYESSPGGVKRWPSRLEDLTDDTRFVGIKRHMREVYPDPVGRKPWGVVSSPDGGIAGVFSQSDAQPIRTGTMELDALALPAAARYADWQFVYMPVPGKASSPR
jgi:type II secretory pathway pseudopilin PulG